MSLGNDLFYFFNDRNLLTIYGAGDLFSVRGRNIVYGENISEIFPFRNFVTNDERIESFYINRHSIILFILEGYDSILCREEFSFNSYNVDRFFRYE